MHLCHHFFVRWQILSRFCQALLFAKHRKQHGGQLLFAGLVRLFLDGFTQAALGLAVCVALHIVHTLVLLHRGIAAGIVVDLGQIGADHLDRGLIVAHLFQLLRAGDIVHHAAVHREEHLLKLVGTALFHLAVAMLDQRFVAVFVRLLSNLNDLRQQSRIGAGGPAGIGYRQHFLVLTAAQQRAQIQLGIAQAAVIRLPVGRNANAVQLDILGIPLADGLPVGIVTGAALHVHGKAANRLVRGGQQFFPQIILAQVMNVLLCYRQPCTAFKLIGIRIDAGHTVRDLGGLFLGIALLAKHFHAVCAAVGTQCVLIILAQ